MKRMIFATLFAYSMSAGYAQDSLKNTSRGTWVVESNINSPKNQVVKFYNSRLELIYEESITNRRIRYEKERIKKALNKTLEIALDKEKKMEPGTFATILKARTR